MATGPRTLFEATDVTTPKVEYQRNDGFETHIFAATTVSFVGTLDFEGNFNSEGSTFHAVRVWTYDPTLLVASGPAIGQITPPGTAHRWYIVRDDWRRFKITRTTTSGTLALDYFPRVGEPSLLAGSGGSGFSGSSTPVANRLAVNSADVISAPGTVTCTKQAGGSATAGVYTVFVVAGNTYGRTTATQGNTTVTTETTNLTVRAAFAAVTGATFYDIYMSTDGAAAKWVGRITETQRGTGIKITAVGVTGAGSIAGAVDVEVTGTGLAVNAGHLVVNNAYSIPAAPVDCSGRQYVDFDLSFSRTGDSSLGSLIVIPFFYDSTLAFYFAGDAINIYFGGAANFYQANRQRLRVEARGNPAMVLVVASITGTGASLDIESTVS